MGLTMLIHEIDNWDGKSTDQLSKTYKRFCSSDTFSTELIKLVSDANRSVAASWLLKRHVEQHALPARRLTTLARLCKASLPWEAQLHLLQLFAGQTFTPAQTQHLEPFCRQGILSSNKFVRAWSYNLLHELAQQCDDLKQDVHDIIVAAQRDEAPSVKARLRQLKNIL